MEQNNIEFNSSEAKMEALSNMENRHVINTDKEIDGGVLLTSQWHDVERSKLAHGGAYYKDTIKFKVQSASTHTIKYFSSMDEENPLIVQDAINKILETHVMVLDGNKRLNVLDTVYNYDRLNFVLLVALYTGTGNELKGEIVCKGGEGKPCNHKQPVKVINSSLTFEEPSEKGINFFNGKKGLFEINTKTLGKHIYKPLSLREDMEVAQFSIEKFNDGDKIDKLFTDYAGFFMHKKTPNNKMEDIYRMYLKSTSDLKLISFYNDVVTNNIKLEQKMELSTTCEKCGRLGENRIVSIDKLRNIFFVSNIAEEY